MSNASSLPSRINPVRGTCRWVNRRNRVLRINTVQYTVVPVGTRYRLMNWNTGAVYLPVLRLGPLPRPGRRRRPLQTHRRPAHARPAARDGSGPAPCRGGAEWSTGAFLQLFV